MAEPMLAEPLDDVSADSGAMSEDELATLLGAHETAAIGYYTSEIAEDQAKSLNYYYGRPFGDEQEGRSQVVDRTVQIVVDNAVAALLKPFVSADDAVVFEPRGPEDEETAKQATEYVNYVFQVDNNGFLLLHDWFKSALLEKVGIVKTWWETSQKRTAERLEGLDGASIEQMMAGGPDFEVIGGPYLDEDGLFAIDIERTQEDGRVRIETVPSEEFRIAPFARSIESAEYAAHVPSNVTRSDLIDMGIEPDVVDALPSSAGETDGEGRAQARYGDESYDGGRQHIGLGGDASMDRIDLRDEYILVDFDGDGIAERRRVLRVNEVILRNEEVEDNPFALLCPVPMPHKVYGQSIADQTRDLQRISSVLWRQTLDNLYLANNPKVEVPDQAVRPDGSTYDDLQDPAPGGIVRTKQPNMISPMAIPFVADKSFPMLAFVEQQQEARTGISRSGQGLDADALKKGNMTATEIAQIAEGKNARVELIARIFAETGVKRLFRQILRLLIRHQPRERMIRLRNQWVQIDPRGWNAEMDLVVTVGLGVGSKMEQLAKADSILTTLAEVIQSPFTQLVGPEQAYHAISRKLNAAGVKDTERYLNDPTQLPPQQDKPDPEMAKVQANAMIEAQKLQQQQQQADFDNNLKAQQQQNDAALASQRNEFDLQAKREQAMLSESIARQKAEFEASLALRQQEFEEDMAERRFAFDQDMASRKAATVEASELPKKREGGDLSK